MTNGLGAGFAALPVLVVPGGLSPRAVVATTVSLVYYRREGGVAQPFHQPLLGVCALAPFVAGFGTLVLADETPLLAGLIPGFALVVVAVPLSGRFGRAIRSPASKRTDGDAVADA